MGTVLLSGIVGDANRVGLAGATVSAMEGVATTTTDANGLYSLEVTAAVGGVLSVGARHSSHAANYRSLPITSRALQQNFSLQAYDLTQTIALPAAGGAEAVATVIKDDASFAIAVPAGSLVTASGAVASGNANLNIAYWHPNESLTTVPSVLYGATDAGTRQMLSTAGMADVVIEQGGVPLEVAVGQTLQFNFLLPANVASIVSNAAMLNTYALWSADENQGVWVKESALDNNTLSYASQSNTFVAKISHLSGWNIDGLTQLNGCVTGTVDDACGKPVASQQVTLWLLTDATANTYGDQKLGDGAISQYLVTTDATGKFCTDFLGSGDNDASGTVRGTNRVASAYYFVSAASDPNNAVCNPTGKSTFAQLCNAAQNDPNTSHFCTGCDPGTGGDQFNERCTENFAVGLQSCNTPKADLHLCGSCKQGDYPMCVYANDGANVPDIAPVVGACTDLGTLKVPYCGSPNSANSCTKNYQEGDYCDASTPPYCCKPNVLICNDTTCVPVNPTD